MKKISLTQNEVNDLVDLYQSEIDRAQRRIVNLKAILKKLTEGNSLPIKGEVTAEKLDVKSDVQPKKRGRKPAVQAQKVDKEEVAKLPKRRGRKPKVKVESPKKKLEEKPIRKSIKKGKGEEKVKWIDLIYDILRSKKSLMLSNSLTLAAMERLNIPAVDKNRVRMAISTNLTRLTKYDKTINKFSHKGTAGAFYGLAEWFDDKGMLKSEFNNKLM